MKIKVSLLPAALFILFGCRNNGDSNGNLVPDPGFENLVRNEAAGWTVKKTDGVSIFRSGITDEAHSGNHAFTFGRVWTNAWEMNGIKTEKPVPLDPANKYLLTFWYKTKGIQEYPIPLVARLNVHRENHEPLRYQKFISASEEWTRILWLPDTLPPDATGADIEFLLWIRTRGSILIDDVSLRVAGPEDIAGYNAWRTLPVPEIKQEPEHPDQPATGFYETVKAGERWWLADPMGRLTWAIASMGEIPGGRGNGNIRLAQWFEKEYKGNRMAYAGMQYDLLESWGINSLAGWTVDEFARLTEERYKRGSHWFPMYRVLNFSIMGSGKSYYARNNKGESKGVSDHSFPDPFNPAWRRDARKKAEETIADFKGKPWFVGWFMDNEIDYSSLFEYVWGDYSAVEFIHYLKDKYGTIGRLNDAWSSGFKTYSYATFEDILSEKPAPVEWEDPLYADFIAFERIMIREYIDYTSGMVRELDPDHLIISNRLNLDPMMSLYRSIDLWSAYDIVCVNIYPENLFTGLSKGELEILDRIHEKTGRPVMIGEWSIPAMDSGLYNFSEDSLGRPLDWSWPQVVKNQRERGRSYRTCMMQLATRPYMIGAAWFKILDVDSPNRRANRGLIGGDHQPYTEFVKVFSETNHEIRDKLNIPW